MQRVVALLLLSAFAPAADALTEKDLPDPPIGAWMRVQPVDVPWPQGGFPTGIRADIGGFGMLLPVPERVLLLGDSLTLYGKQISLQLSRVMARHVTGGAPGLRRVFSRSRYPVADYPRLVFQVTDHLPAGMSQEDRWVLRSATAEKSLLVRSGQRLYRTQKACLTAFFSTLPGKERNWLVMVSDKRDKDAYLAVYLFKAGRKVVDRLLAGMQTGRCKNGTE